MKLKGNICESGPSWFSAYFFYMVLRTDSEIKMGAADRLHVLVMQYSQNVCYD